MKTILIRASVIDRTEVEVQRQAVRAAGLQADDVQVALRGLKEFCRGALPGMRFRLKKTGVLRISLSLPFVPNQAVIDALLQELWRQDIHTWHTFSDVFHCYDLLTFDMTVDVASLCERCCMGTTCEVSPMCSNALLAALR